MEGITLLVSIILIIFGVLQIILFFKLWGMTNDIKRITRRFNCDSDAYLPRIVHPSDNVYERTSWWYLIVCVLVIFAIVAWVALSSFV